MSADRADDDAPLGLEPVPDTREALRELDPYDEQGLVERLRDSAGRVRRVVPECIGLSITLAGDGLTFTLVASEAELATLDAVQYLAGGPCAEVAGEGERAQEHRMADLADGDWSLFAAAGAAAGVASTLTLPMLDEQGVVEGSVNLYGARPGCFAGHHDELAKVLAAWAPGAETDRDLAFRTRQQAARATDRIRDEASVATATGLVAVRDGVTLEVAERSLRDAAERAGIPPAELAEAVVRAHEQEVGSAE